MDSNTKQSPKSCSCSACRRGKGSRSGKQMMRLDQRSFRRYATMILLRWRDCGDDTPPAAPRGGHYD